MLLGLAAAGGATVLFNVGAALQALSARTRPANESMRWLLLWRLAHERAWLAGMVLTALGFPLQLIALSDAPLSVVQPVLSTGLLVLLGLCLWLLHERMGVREMVGVPAIVLGLGLLVSHSPGNAAHVDGLAVPLLVIAVMLALSAIPAYARGGREQAGAAIWGSGLMLAASSLATKGVSDALSGGDYASAAVWIVVAAGTGAFALLLQMSAIQRSPANRVFPVSVALQTALPVLLAPLILGGADSPWHSSDVLGLGVLVCGLAVVASAGSVGHLATGAPRPRYADAQG